MMSSKVSKTRLESQFARRYCQMFSTGLSSGAREGSQIGVMFLHDEAGRGVPAGAIEEQHGMRADRDVGRDLLEMPLHRIGVSAGQRERRAHSAGRTNGAEQKGALITLVSRLARPRSPPRPLAHEAVLLTDARLILEPNLDGRSLRQIGQMDVQDLGEVS